METNNTQQAPDDTNLDGEMGPGQVSAMAEANPHAPAAWLAYARAKELAMIARMAGDIRLARCFERDCERFYAQIPAEWSW